MTDVVTDWSPLKKGGANFRTHKLVSVDVDTVVFEPSTGALVFYWIFLLFGIVPFGLGIWQILENGFAMKPEILAPIGFGIVFGVIGLVLFGFGTRPIVFDLSRDYYWKGRKDPDEAWDKSELKNFADLTQVVGLQIITEVVSGDKGSYTSHELNLVLKDGSRLNVVDHGNEEKLRADAEVLAEFLEVEILVRRQTAGIDSRQQTSDGRF